MAFSGALRAPVRPGAGGLAIRRSGPDQVPEQAAPFRHRERQQIGLAIECAFSPAGCAAEYGR